MVEYYLSDPSYGVVSINYDELKAAGGGLNIHTREVENSAGEELENIELSTYVSFVEGKALEVTYDFVVPDGAYNDEEVESIFNREIKNLGDSFNIQTNATNDNGYIDDKKVSCETSLIVECKQILRFVIGRKKQ
tara:strand:+ start:117 stop:521 length:405 start_codon:yes stop_codon:yes gene_type:complete